MRVAGIATGPVVGYRLWRILPFQDLEGPPSVRLCAAGTLGTPKVWPVRAAVVAVCSNFKTTHAAPWPSHECGVWALRSLEAAEARVEQFVDTDNFVGSYGWAVGEVALWGRVIEHEQGYRAQYAYPGALTVTTRREHAALELAAAYGVPVEWVRRRRLRVPVTVDKGDDEPTKVLREARTLLRKAESLLAAPEPPPRADYAALWREETAQARAACARLEPIVLSPPDLERDEVLVAFAMDVAQTWWRPTPTQTAVYLLERRGHEGPFTTYCHASINRRGFLSVRAKVVRTMEAAAEEGLLETGRRQGESGKQRSWYLTAPGIRHVESLLAALPLTMVVQAVRKWVEGEYINKDMAVDVLGHVADLAPRDPALTPFNHEIDAERDLWTQERKRVAREGRAVYRAWLAEHRALPFAGNKIAFSDDEVVRALRRVCRHHDGPVDFATFAQELAPGRVLASERAVLSYQLGRLTRAGDVTRAREANRGPKLWTVVTA